MLAAWKKICDRPGQWIINKKERHHFANKGPCSQSYGFSSSHVQIWELDHKEGWAPKNWHFQTVVLEKTLKSPLDCKEIKPINPKGNQPWIFIGRTDAEAKAPTLWLPDVKSWLIGKDPDVGKDWGREKKGMREDEMVGWHHWLNGHDLSKLQDSKGQGGLVCCGPWGRRESDTTRVIEQQNNKRSLPTSYSVCLQPVPLPMLPIVPWAENTDGVTRWLKQLSP